MNNGIMFFINATEENVFDEIENYMDMVDCETDNLTSVICNKYNLKRSWEIQAIKDKITENFEFYEYYFQVRKGVYCFVCDCFNNLNVKFYGNKFYSFDYSYYNLSISETNTYSMELTLSKANAICSNLLFLFENEKMKIKFKNIRIFENIFSLEHIELIDLKKCKTIDELRTKLSALLLLPLDVSFNKVAENPQKYNAVLFD